jgi:kynureninase
LTEPIAPSRFDLDDAQRLDADDPLASLRGCFNLPDGIYLDGNSLGAQPRQAIAALNDVVQRQWGADLIASWNKHDWIGQPQRLGRLIAPLIGARPHEVIVADTTSTNLFKLIGAALLARPDRPTILSEPGNFPTDLYVAEGAVRMLGDRRLRTVSVDEIVDAIDEDTALVMLTHVHYKSGRKLDMAAITAAAHAKGALVLWDLSHSTGAVAVDLNRCNVDMAVGCGYKYLNGGPGAPAFLFVVERLQSALLSPLSGWMGHDSPFAFNDSYRPASGITRFLCGTPSVLGMAALECGLALFGAVDLPALFDKASALGALYIRLMDERCSDMGFTLASPRSDADRGSHVSYVHDRAYPICQALIARGIVGDFRAPDTLRMGFAPLTTRYEDIWRAVEAIRDVMATRAWDDERFEMRAKVT